MESTPGVTVEVLALAPTAFYHCQHCEITFREMGIGERVQREHAKESLPDDLREEFHALSDWIHGAYERYGGRIRIKVVDAASIEGFVKSIKYRARTYPTIVINGEKHVQPDLQDLDRTLDRHLTGRSDPDRKEATPTHSS